MRLVLRIGINAIALWMAASLVPGIELTSEVTGILMVAIVFGLINALLKPLATVLSLPAIVLTLGFFILIVNAAMLALAAALTDSLDIDDFGAALLGAIVVSIVSWALSMLLPDEQAKRRDQQQRPHQGWDDHGRR